MANPLLTGVQVEYPDNAIQDLTQNSYQHFYDGSEIVVAGRLVDEDMNSFTADVKGQGVSGDQCLGTYWLALLASVSWLMSGSSCSSTWPTWLQVPAPMLLPSSPGSQ